MNLKFKYVIASFSWCTEHMHKKEGRQLQILIRTKAKDQSNHSHYDNSSDNQCSFMKMSLKPSLRTRLSATAVRDIQVFDSDLWVGTYVNRMNIPSGLNLIAIGTFVPGGPFATSSLVKKEFCIENDWLIRRRSCWVWLSNQIYVCYNVAEEREFGKSDWNRCTIDAWLGSLLSFVSSTNDVSLTLKRIGGWRVLLPPKIENTSSLRWNSLWSIAS